MTPLESALQAVGRKWYVLPVGRDKVPLIKWGKGASRNLRLIEWWWRQWPDANVGIVTGSKSGFAVLDIDGPKGRALLAQYSGPLPDTLAVTSGRPEGGEHRYFLCPEAVSGIALDGLELKANGQYAVGVGSVHESGAVYDWANQHMIAPLPPELVAWMDAQPRASRRRKPRTPQAADMLASRLGPRPAYLNNAVPINARAVLPAVGFPKTASIEDIEAAMVVIPNPDEVWDEWKVVGMTIWASCEGAATGLVLFETWSRKSTAKWKEGGAEKAWAEITNCPPNDLGFGSLVTRARTATGDPNWLPPSRRPRPAVPAGEPAGEVPSPQPGPFANGMNVHAQPFFQGSDENPLILLNKRYSVVEDLGGKCLVMSWVPSKIDDAVKVPSFQSFKSFSERYANRYITIGSGEDKEVKQLGPYWLKWTKRKSFESIDLVPNGPAVLPDNVLNLWNGFAIEPVRGVWPLMQRHIGQVLAGGDATAAWYITKFAAWAVQHPGERAEVALVFRGGKGSGKGTFANALRRVFGQHGLQIFNSKHLVGAFNGHLRNCLLLFADEAFWAGDKQGESVLKGLITEQALMIEQKGVDAAPWRNRLHIIMAANADWVVPASHDERRYAMFDVSGTRIGDKAYFDALHAEMRNGGLAAMLWDLQRLDLGDWHPREIVRTAALQEQKELSLQLLQAWWEALLQGGMLPGDTSNAPNEVGATRLLMHLRDHIGSVREANATALGRFLRRQGCDGFHTRDGNIWRFKPLAQHRAAWVRHIGTWTWRNNLADWQPRTLHNPSSASQEQRV
jgi:hypothetical protein